MLIETIATIAKDLPDEELLRLEVYALYLKGREGKKPIVDRRIELLQELAESKGAVLYSILFREAGVGIQWFEEKRAGPHPSQEWKDATPGYEETFTYRDELDLWHNRGLVIYGYYPTLSEALNGEWMRLEETE